MHILFTKEEIDKTNGKVVFDFSKVKTLLEKYAVDLEKVEVYYQAETTEVKNVPSMAKTFDLN